MTQYAGGFGSGTLNNVGLSNTQLTSTWGSGDFDSASLNSSGHQNVFARAESEPKHECITCAEGMDELVAKGQTWSCECCGFLVGTQGKHEGCGFNNDGEVMCSLCYSGQCDCDSETFGAEYVHPNQPTKGRATSSPIIWDSKKGQLIDPPMFTVWIGNDTEHFKTFEEALEFAKNDIEEDEEAQITISYYATLKDAETFEAQAGSGGILYDDDNNGSMVLKKGWTWLEGSTHNEDYYGKCDSCSEDLDAYYTGYVVDGTEWSICMDCFDKMPGREGVTIEMKNGEKRAETFDAQLYTRTKTGKRGICEVEGCYGQAVMRTDDGCRCASIQGFWRCANHHPGHDGLYIVTGQTLRNMGWDGNSPLPQVERGFGAETHSHTPHEYYTPVGPSETASGSEYVSHDAGFDIDSFMAEGDSYDYSPESYNPAQESPTDYDPTAVSFSAEYDGPSTLSSALSGARKTDKNGRHLTIIQRLVAKYGIEKGTRIYKHFGVKQKRASPKVRGKVRGTASGPRRYSEGRVGGAGRSQVYQKGDRTGSWTPSGGYTTSYANSGKAWYQERGYGTPVMGPVPDTALAGKAMGEKARGRYVNPAGIVGYPFVPAQQREQKRK